MECSLVFRTQHTHHMHHTILDNKVKWVCLLDYVAIELIQYIHKYYVVFIIGSCLNLSRILGVFRVMQSTSFKRYKYILLVWRDLDYFSKLFCL